MTVFSIHSAGPGPDPKVRENLETMVAMLQARERWFWRVIGFSVSVATVTSAVVSVLSYLQ